MRTLLVLTFAALNLIACGGDDGDDDDDPGGYGTCDLRAQRGTCIEATSTPINIRNQEEGCLDAGASWSTDACPDDELVGCCEYTRGTTDFRECFYVNATQTNPEEACTTIVDGDWTPAADYGSC